MIAKIGNSTYNYRCIYTSAGLLKILKIQNTKKSGHECLNLVCTSYLFYFLFLVCTSYILSAFDLLIE